VGAGAAEPPDDRIALGDQLDDTHPHVGERRPERCDPGAGGTGQPGRVKLVDALQPAAVHHLVNQSMHDRLVAFEGVGVGGFSVIASRPFEWETPIVRAV
jgi:hypothetical protein